MIVSGSGISLYGGLANDAVGHLIIQGEQQVLVVDTFNGDVSTTSSAHGLSVNDLIILLLTVVADSYNTLTTLCNNCSSTTTLTLSTSVAPQSILMPLQVPAVISLKIWTSSQHMGQRRHYYVYKWWTTSEYYKYIPYYVKVNSTTAVRLSST